MVLVNDPFSEIMGFSSTKGNAMTVVAYSGTQINTLTDPVDGQVVYCHTSGSIFLRGHWYGYDAVNTKWIDLATIPSNSEFFTSDSILNKGMVIDRRSPSKGQFISTNSGTGSAVSDTLGDNSFQTVKLDTGTTTTGYAAIYAGGPLLDWGQPVTLKVKFYTSDGAVTGQINKLGVNIDRAGLGPSNRKNFGIEWCDGDSSFQIHSGNGTSQSNFDTNITVTSGADWSVSMYFYPGDRVDVDFDNGTTVTPKSKTTFIPSSGSSTEDGLMKFSISNNAGNTTSRNLEIMAAYLVYSTADSWWS